MDDIVILDECVNDRCGEVYLSNDGILIFLCTLCNQTFKGYGVYLEHILCDHDLPVYSVEDVASTAITDDLDNLDNTTVDGELQNDIKDYSSISSEIQTMSDFSIDYIVVEDENVDKEEEYPNNENAEVQQITQKQTSVSRNKTTLPDFECPYCKLVIKGKSNLEKHVLRHNDENKRYQCSYCPKRFHVRFEKFQHECTHTGERPFLCSECGKGFISRGKLNEHTNITHKNIRSKQCEICHKNFYSNKFLKRHMLIHLPDRTHICDHCGTSFKMRKTLLAHKKLHENKFEHKCHICPSRFNQRPGLYSHMRTHHKQELKPDT